MSATITVLRVEHCIATHPATGMPVGPYTAELSTDGDEELAGFARKLGVLHNAEQRQRPGWMWETYSENGRRYQGFIAQLYGWLAEGPVVAGFASDEQAQAWFDEDLRRSLDKLGYWLVPYEVPVDDVRIADHQCAFRPHRAQRKDPLPLA